MAEVLKRALGDALTFMMPSGGFFFWAALSEEVQAADLLESARDRCTRELHC